MNDESNDEISNKLLSDDRKWWDFLDADTYEVKSDLPRVTRVTSDMLDWTSLLATERRSPIGFGFFNRCRECGQPAPPDLTFCVHCGGQPVSPQSVKRYSIVIKELRDIEARNRVAEIIASSGYDLKLGEVTVMLDELPAVFNVDVRKDRVAAIVARLSEFGVSSRSFASEDISTLMLKETLETIQRDKSQLLKFVGVLLASIALGFWVYWPLTLLGLGFLAWLFAGRREWYDARYRLDDVHLLNNLAGFDDGVALQAAELLRRTRDAEIRKSFTTCLMEYYALHQMMRQQTDHYSGVLSASETGLRDLMSTIVETMGRFGALYATLESLDPARGRSRLAEISQRMAATTDSGTLKFLEQEQHHVQAQQRQVENLHLVRGKFAARMHAMAGSLEAMRNRMTHVSAVRENMDVRMEDVLKELDDDLEVFEQTFAELEPAVHIS